MDGLLAEKWRRFDFKMCGVVLFKSHLVIFFKVNGNMFLENGNMFLENGKPFLDNSQIPCGFLKYA